MGSDSERGAAMMYDVTAGEVLTPGGPGKFISYCPITGLTIVEHDHRHEVCYAGEDVIVSDQRSSANRAAN